MKVNQKRNEIELEFERIEKEMKSCKCGNGLSPVLGECNLCDVRYAKWEGMRFAIHQMIKDELEWQEKQIVSRHPIDFYNRMVKLKNDLIEYNFGELIE
jgi:hypothetical protein